MSSVRTPAIQKLTWPYTALPEDSWRKRGANDDDYDTVLSRATMLYVTGLPHTKAAEPDEPALVYLPNPTTDPGLRASLHAVQQALPHIKYISDYRTDGLKTTSRTFGLNPRNTVRHDYCAASSLDWEQPVLYAHLGLLAAIAQVCYAYYAPARYAQHREWVAPIHLPWRLGGTCYTSGIINSNNPLLYHVDRGNWPYGYSAQYTWRGATTGGLLVLPELRVAFDLGEGSLLLFNGGTWVHGVTPITRLTPTATRYSLVLYSRQGAIHCGTPEEEAKRIQMLRTDREARPRKVIRDE